MNDQQIQERIIGLVNQWRASTKFENVVASTVAWQGLTVGWNPFGDPYPLYSRGKAIN